VSESAAMRASERMSAVDRAWLLMDRPTNPMVVIGLLVLRRPLRHAALRRLLAERFLSFERFRCVPALEPLGGRWERAEQFNLDDHVLQVALPAPGGKRELELLAGELASTPLNRGRPLWSFHHVQRYQGGSALVVRIHHCYADGIALMGVLTQLADSDAGAEAGADAETRTAPSILDNGPAGETAAGRESVGRVPQVLGQVLQEGSKLLEKSLHYTLHPSEAAAAARGALGVAGELANIGVLLSDEPATRLTQPLTGVRRAAWAEPLALEEVRILGRVLGCTVNDVLIATLAGAVGRYLESKGDQTAGLGVRAAVPVNLRGDNSAPQELGNRFGLVFVDLPVGIHHPLDRLYAVRRSMQALKGSSQAMVTYGLLAVIGSLPAAVEEPAIALFSAKASLVASNLRGPSGLMNLAGAPISQLLFWVPQAGSIGTGVSMFSYGGEVQFGVIADRGLIPDPGELVALIQTEFDRLVFLILLGGGSLMD
jgi:diacylglycerol O-acyltransferase / wax synthase